MGAFAFIMTPMPHVLATISLLFFFIACIVPDWSNGTVSRPKATPAAFGEFTVGLWQACSDITNSGNQVGIFSTLGDCRQGHCVRDERFALDSSWDSQNLCDKAATVQAFTIVSIFTSILTIFFTSWRAIAGRTILWGKGTVFSIMSFFFSLIAWATWADWNNTMNDNPAASGEDKNQFSELDLGPGFALTIIGSLCCLVNIFLMRNRYLAAVKAETARMQRRSTQLSAGDGKEDMVQSADDPYLEVSGEETRGNHVPNIPVPARPSGSMSLQPVDNKQTAL